MRSWITIIRATSAIVMAAGAMVAAYYATRDDPAVGLTNVIYRLEEGRGKDGGDNQDGKRKGGEAGYRKPKSKNVQSLRRRNSSI